MNPKFSMKMLITRPRYSLSDSSMSSAWFSDMRPASPIPSIIMIKAAAEYMGIAATSSSPAPDSMLDMMSSIPRFFLPMAATYIAPAIAPKPMIAVNSPMESASWR